MSNENYWDDDEDDNNVGNGEPSEAMKALRKKARADAKTIDELTAKFETLSKAQREATVKSVLEKQGVNPKMARIILKDIDDASEESVQAWLTENADIVPGSKKPDITADEQAELDALEGQDGLTRSAGAPGSGNGILQALENAQSQEEFDAIIASQQ